MKKKTTKKTMKAWALGLTLAMAAAALGGITPARSSATEREITVAEAVRETPSWMIDGDWIPAEDTTVTDEIQKMISEPFLHMVGAGHQAVMYMGSQVTESGTNHCVLVRSFPVVPNPIYSYSFYYVTQDADGKYKIYNMRKIEESEYSEYSVIKYVKLDKTTIKLKKGKKTVIKAQYFPETDDQVTYEWFSTDKKVATVKNGVVKAKKKGTCAIYCRVKGVEETNAMCLVKVKQSK